MKSGQHAPEGIKAYSDPEKLSGAAGAFIPLGGVGNGGLMPGIGRVLIAGGRIFQCRLILL